MNLDVDSPDTVPDVLREAAQAYYESAQELSSAWQDPGAGKIWEYIAKRFDTLADQIERQLD